MYDYEAREDGELSIQEHDQLFVLDDSNEDWWNVKLVSRPGGEGLVPKTYVELQVAKFDNGFTARNKLSRNEDQNLVNERTVRQFEEEKVKMKFAAVEIEERKKKVDAEADIRQKWEDKEREKQHAILNSKIQDENRAALAEKSKKYAENEREKHEAAKVAMAQEEKRAAALAREEQNNEAKLKAIPLNRSFSPTTSKPPLPTREVKLDDGKGAIFNSNKDYSNPGRLAESAAPPMPSRPIGAVRRKSFVPDVSESSIHSGNLRPLAPQSRPAVSDSGSNLNVKPVQDSSSTF